MQKIFGKVFGLVYRAVIRMIDDSESVQKAQIDGLSGETLDDVGVYGQFGLTANIPVDTDAIAVNVGASREHSVIIATNSDCRPKNLITGDVTIYDGHGNKIELKTGVITITGTSIVLKGNVTLNSTASLLGLGATKAAIHEDVKSCIQNMLTETTAKDSLTGNVTFTWGFTSDPNWIDNAKSTTTKVL